jgi:hypothetical protein
MEYEALKWVALSLLSVVVYFLKRTVDQTETALLAQKLAHAQLQAEVQTIKSEYLHKSDFKEFKQELRGMFDDLKSDIRGLREHSN